jgi:hypothetical protein
MKWKLVTFMGHSSPLTSQARIACGVRIRSVETIKLEIKPADKRRDVAAGRAMDILASGPFGPPASVEVGFVGAPDRGETSAARRCQFRPRRPDREERHWRVNSDRNFENTAVVIRYRRRRKVAASADREKPAAPAENPCAAALGRDRYNFSKDRSRQHFSRSVRKIDPAPPDS